MARQDGTILEGATWKAPCLPLPLKRKYQVLHIYIYIYVWASIASNQLSYGLEGLDEWLLLSRSGQVRVDRQHHRPSFRLQFHRYTFAERDS